MNWMPSLHITHYSVWSKKHTGLLSKIKDTQTKGRVQTAFCEYSVTLLISNSSSELWPLMYSCFPVRMLSNIFSSVINTQLFPRIFQETGRENFMPKKHLCSMPSRAVNSLLFNETYVNIHCYFSLVL